MKKGDIIRISYTGKIKQSGKVFDTTSEKVAEEENIKNPNVVYGSVPVILGSEGLIEGLNEALLDMDIDEKRKVEIAPEKGFGKRKSELIDTLSEKEFKEQDITPRPGMTLNLGGRKARILSVNSGRVRIDMNHPLAGKEIIYEIKIENKVEGRKNKIQAVAEFYLGKAPEVELEEGKGIIQFEKEIPENIQEEIEEKVKKYIDEVEIEFTTKGE